MNILAGHRSTPRRLHQLTYPANARHGAGFRRLSGGWDRCIFWRSGFRQSSASPYHAGTSAHHSIRLDMAAGFLACSCPLLAFRPQVTIRLENLPLTSQLRWEYNRAPRGALRLIDEPPVGGACRQGHCCIEAQGVLGSYRRGMQARQAPQRTVTNRASERLLHGFWPSRGPGRGVRSLCNSA